MEDGIEKGKDMIEYIFVWEREMSGEMVVTDVTDYALRTELERVNK